VALHKKKFRAIPEGIAQRQKEAYWMKRFLLPECHILGFIFLFKLKEKKMGRPLAIC
jgi:hypothetical protein